ncbi:MAG: PAS domain S-box protein [Proteobacteria bacterium]|nr:PAS domain S-box protein [Pseudomonadota bacterium]
MSQKPTNESLENKIKELENESIQKKEIEKNLLVSEKKLTSLLKGIPIPIYIWKKEENNFFLTDYNDAAMAITANKIAKFKGHSATEMYSHMPEIYQEMMTCYKTRIPIKREMDFHFRTTGKSRILSVTYGFVPPDFVVIHTEDITDRKHAETELKKALDRLESQVEERTKELEKINHSLREEIHARKIAQKHSNENEERFRSLADQLPDVIVSFDKAHRHVYANRSVEKYTKIQQDRFIGASMLELGFDKENLPKWDNILYEVFETGKTRRAEFHHSKKLWFDWLFIPEKDDDGHVRTVLASGRDITGIKNARIALEESENLFRTFVDSSRSAIFIIQENHFKYFNDALMQISGYNDQELITMPYWELVHPDMREMVIERANQRQRGLNPESHYEIKLLSKDRKTKYLDFTATIHEFEGKFAIFCTAFDITESNLAKENLRESEEKYRAIIQNIEEAYFEVDLEGNLTFFNDSLCRITGRTRGELAGLNYRVYTSPEMKEKMFRIFNEVYTTGNPASITNYEVITRANKTLFLELSTSLIKDKDGVSRGFRGIVRDNTEKLLAEKTKKELEHQLQQALRIEAIGTLAGGIAHDFNNLLTGIQGNLSILKIRKKPEDPEFKKILLIEDLVQSGAELTRQLLGFAMGGKYEVKPYDANEIIEKSLKMIDRTKKAITIKKEFAADLFTVEVDRGQMEQVLLNIFVNAAHAMPDGGNLSLSTENVILDETASQMLDLKPGNYIKISVSDNGIGMDEKTATRVFEPFFTTKEMGRGTGLGLASAYGIIKNHNGSISVNSKKGEGTTFLIYLPASQKIKFIDETPELEIKKGRETILFVDDEKPIRDIGVELLSEIGYQVVALESGRMAIEYFANNHSTIDLVILDMVMPGMGGRETFDKLKTIRKDAKIILSSGYSIDEQTSEILEKGGEGFIQKPFSLKELSQKIRFILDT